MKYKYTRDYRKDRIRMEKTEQKHFLKFVSIFLSFLTMTEIWSLLKIIAIFYEYLFWAIQCPNKHVT